MTVYRCKLVSVVTTSRGSEAFRRSVVLPFVPFVGMNILGVCNYTEDEEVEGLEVDGVSWDYRNKEFYVGVSGYDEEENRLTPDELAREELGPEWTRDQ